MQSIDFFTKETDTSSFILDVLSSVDYSVETHSDATPRNQIASIVIWDLDSFKGESVAALARVRTLAPDAMILAYAENPEAYAEIPGNLYDILLSVEALRLHLMSKISKLKEIQSARRIFTERMSHLVGKSESMKKLRKMVERAILHTGPVLIQGESGVGKDLVARAIACMYDKFVVVNCSAIPDTLFESELFGHTRGAFTGAQNERIGLFEDANGGAIFLDEIGDMPLHAQVKLLRVIQNHEIRPIGANKTRHIDVRIIAATNRDLREEIREKRFREDLYFRIQVLPLELPPLRDRGQDVVLLAENFIQRYGAEYGRGKFHLSRNAEKALLGYHWPGNVRELENRVQKGLVQAVHGVIQPKDLGLDDMQVQAKESPRTLKEAREAVEREVISRALKDTNANLTLASTILGIDRKVLREIMERLGLKKEDFKV